MRKYRNQIIMGVLLVIGLYAGLLIFADSQGYFSTDGLLDAFRTFDWRVVPFVIVCQLGAAGFRFVEWHYYLGVVDARNKISFWDSLILQISSFTMVITPGKAGELAKSVVLKAKTGVPIARSAPIAIAERVVDGIAVLALMSVTLLIAGDTLNLGDQYADFSRLLIFTSTGLIIAGLIVVQIRPLAYLFLRILGYIPLLKRLKNPLTEFYESSREVFQLRHVIPMSIVGIGVYASSTAGFVLILWGFGLEVTGQLILQTAFILGVASAIGAFSFVPNGAGVTEVSNVAMLLALVAPIQPMVTPVLAAAIALLQGFFHKWFRVVLGFVVALIFRKRLFSGDLEMLFQQLENESETPHDLPATTAT